MLEFALCPILREQGHKVIATDIRMISEDLGFLDVRDLEQVRNLCQKILPDAILHLPAETDLGLYETNVEHAYSTNTIGTRNIVRVCRDMEIPILYVSSIGVFVGNKVEPHVETYVPNPISVYGQTKWAGEIIV